VSDELEDFFAFWLGPRVRHRDYDELVAFVKPLRVVYASAAIGGGAVVAARALRRDSDTAEFEAMAAAQALSDRGRKGGLASKAEEIEERNRIIAALKSDVAEHPPARIDRPGWKVRAHRVATKFCVDEDRAHRVAKENAKEILPR
jgi:hypothetical protein